MLTSFAGSKLFGQQYGTGTPWVLALHGWRRDHRDFDGVFTASGLDAVALDLPGFGSAPAPESAWGSQDYARAVAAVLDEMAPHVVVVGHSFGGRVAVHLAREHSDRVVRSMAKRGWVSEDRLESLRHRYGSDDYRASSGVMRDVLVRTLAEDYIDVLESLDCPVELVWGDNDREVPIAVADKLQAMLKNAHLVACPGAGHLTPLTVPEQLRSAVERLKP